MSTLSWKQKWVTSPQRMCLKHCLTPQKALTELGPTSVHALLLSLLSVPRMSYPVAIILDRDDGREVLGGETQRWKSGPLLSGDPHANPGLPTTKHLLMETKSTIYHTFVF